MNGDRLGQNFDCALIVGQSIMVGDFLRRRPILLPAPSRIAYFTSQRDEFPERFDGTDGVRVVSRNDLFEAPGEPARPETTKGHSLVLAKPMAMNTLVALKIFHLFFIRNVHGTSLTWDAVRGKKVVWIVVVIVTASQVAVTYLPPLQTAFGTDAVPLADGLLIFGIGVAFFALIEIEKQIRLGLRR